MMDGEDTTEGYCYSCLVDKKARNTLVLFHES